MEMPTKIQFLSDDNVLTLDEDSIETSGNETTGMYTYTKSLTKKGTTIEISLSYIKKLLGTNIVIPKTAKWVSKKSETSKREKPESVTKGKTTTELLLMMQTQKRNGSRKGGRK